MSPPSGVETVTDLVPEIAQMPHSEADQMPHDEDAKCHQMPPNNTVDFIGLTDWWDFGEAAAFDAGEWGQEELWRIEKKGKGFIYVLRFVEQRITRNGGAITPYIARQIARRPGRGRWGKSRKEAGRLRRFAEHLATELSQASEGRLSGAIPADATGNCRADLGGNSMPDVFSRPVPDMPDVRSGFIN